MSIYRFSAASPVREIQFRYANDRPPIALIQSSPQATADQLSSIRRLLQAKGVACVTAKVGDKHVLQASEFKDEGHLTALLHAHHFAQGTPRIQAEPGDHPTRSWKEWLEDHNFKAIGVGYIIADIALTISGVLGNRIPEAIAGGLYVLGGGAVLGYGNAKTSHHERKVAEKIGAALKEQGAQLPEESGLFSIMQQKRHGALAQADDFLTRFPSQTMLGLYTAGGLMMLYSGRKNKKPWDVAYGATVSAANVATILIPEKRKDEQAPQVKPPSDDPLQRCLEWIHEKPLRLVGYTYLVGALTLGMSAFREYKDNPKGKAYIYKFITAGTYVIGDLLVALSHKDHTNADGKFDPDEQRRIEALAAEAIAAQPVDMRGPLTQHAAGFLSLRPEMRGTAAEIGASIAYQVEHAAHNPWTPRRVTMATHRPDVQVAR